MSGAHLNRTYRSNLELAPYLSITIARLKVPLAIPTNDLLYPDNIFKDLLYPDNILNIAKRFTQTQKLLSNRLR